MGNNKNLQKPNQNQITDNNVKQSNKFEKK